MENPKSHKKMSSKHSIPGGFKPLAKGFYIDHALGGKCWDQDNNQFIDFICACGPIILGHSHGDVNQAVIKQLQKGMLFPSNTPHHDELKLILHRIFPYFDKSIFLKTGSEAVAASVRLARAFTGKTKIIRCGFHGWHDSFIVPDISWHRYEVDISLRSPVSGVPVSRPDIITWDGKSIDELLGLFKVNNHEIAALIIDPVQIREPIKDNLNKIREITTAEKSLLILDEVKTGFRVSLAGVQGLYGIQPDLTVLSKAIANGFPLSAVIGPSKILDLTPQLKIMGTYNGELLSIVAAIKTISILETPDSIPWLWKVGEQLIDGINKIFREKNISDFARAVPYHWPCMPFILFDKNSDIAENVKSIFYQKLSENGVLMLSNHMNFTCLSHTEEDIKFTLGAISSAVSDALSESKCEMKNK